MKKIILIIIAIIIVAITLFAASNVSEKTEKVDQSNAPPATSIDTKTSKTVALKQGEFMDADGFHKGNGTAQVLKTEQGHVVKFSSDFSVTKGPDLFVYFSKTADENEKDPGEFVSLGRLQSTSGEQIYKLPDDIDGYKSVVIWCRAFSTTFSVATLE